MARTFDGTDDDIIWTDNAVYEPVNVSVCTWYKSDGAQGSDAGLIDKEYQAAPRGAPFVSWKLNANSGGDFYAFQYNSTGTLRTALGTVVRPSTGAVNHVMGTYDGANAIIYVNGSSEKNESQTGDIHYSTGDLNVGSNGAAEFIGGTLGHCTAWSSALSATHVSALNRGVNPFFMRNDILIFYAPLNGNEDPVPDYEQVLTGTLTGAGKATIGFPVELLENNL